MSNLLFIADVIYGLKIEYGELISVGTHNFTQDQRTGIKTDTPSNLFTISMAIPLPENLREAFLKTVGIKKEGRLQSGQREFLIDKSDIPTGMSIIEHRSFIDFAGKRSDVQKVDDYLYAMIVVVEGITGMPTS